MFLQFFSCRKFVNVIVNFGAYEKVAILYSTYNINNDFRRYLHFRILVYGRKQFFFYFQFGKVILKIMFFWIYLSVDIDSKCLIF